MITSGGGVTFTSTLNANSVTVNDSKNSILFNNNLTLLGSLTTNVISDSYALTLLGLNNQIGGRSHQGVQTNRDRNRKREG